MSETIQGMTELELDELLASSKYAEQLVNRVRELEERLTLTKQRIRETLKEPVPFIRKELFLSLCIGIDNTLKREWLQPATNPKEM